MKKRTMLNSTISRTSKTSSPFVNLSVAVRWNSGQVESVDGAKSLSEETPEKGSPKSGFNATDS